MSLLLLRLGRQGSAELRLQGNAQGSQLDAVKLMRPVKVSVRKDGLHKTLVSPGTHQHKYL